jgi:hypothetical protein
MSSRSSSRTFPEYVSQERLMDDLLVTDPTWGVKKQNSEDILQICWVRFHRE